MSGGGGGGGNAPLQYLIYNVGMCFPKGCSFLALLVSDRFEIGYVLLTEILWSKGQNFGLKRIKCRYKGLSFSPLVAG